MALKVTMVYEIGESAGKAWQYLNEHPGSALEEVNKALKLKENLLHMAIGWLAREGKLSFDERGKTLKLSLVPE
jgi:hypothetical protein